MLFRNILKRYAGDGTCKFILDLDEVFYIDSSGFGELPKTYTTLWKIERKVVLMNPSRT